VLARAADADGSRRRHEVAAGRGRGADILGSPPRPRAAARQCPSRSPFRGARTQRVGLPGAKAYQLAVDRGTRNRFVRARATGGRFKTFANDRRLAAGRGSCLPTASRSTPGRTSPSRESDVAGRKTATCLSPTSTPPPPTCSCQSRSSVCSGASGEAGRLRAASARTDDVGGVMGRGPGSPIATRPAWLHRTRICPASLSSGLLAGAQPSA
jgi:hypothetical protein